MFPENQDMQVIRNLLTKTAWWAPVAVLMLHKAVMGVGYRRQTDCLLHFTGGLAITLFIWTLVPVIERLIGALPTIWRFLTTFCGGCTAALFWDFAEFGSDEIFGTNIQQSLKETMFDLVSGASGVTAMIVILLIAAFKGHRSAR
jgi:hypothetical protein